MFTVTVGEDSISTTKYLGFEGSTSESNTRASAQRFCHFISIFCGSYPDPAAVAPPGVCCSATPPYPLFFFVLLFRAPLFLPRHFFFPFPILFFSVFFCLPLFFCTAPP